MFDEKVRHEMESDYQDFPDEVVVGRNRRGEYMVVMDGPSRLETVIEFDRVEIERHTIQFSKECRGQTVSTGSLEGGPEEHGDVGAFLEAFGDV